MINPSATAPVRILPNNKVYRQLFEAQVQLSDAYNRVRNNQLSQSVNITSRPNAVPLIRNFKPHETQKKKWLTSMSFSNDSSINPITISFHDERKRRQNERQQQLDELKREVFNLPDNIEYIETEKNENIIDDTTKKGNITERLASNRETKYNQLWAELLEKISETNQNLLIELEKVTRQCNTYYEQGDNEINEHLQNLIYRKEITSLTIKSFEYAFNELDQYLSPRLSQIQEYCQSIEDLELERIHKIRDLFKYYSDRLYRTHHLSDKDTAYELEKQANELNTHIFDNRRIYAELEAKLLGGETVRIHRYQAELVNYQNKWRDATWIIHKQTWISKLSQCRAKLEPTILSTCESIGTDITTQTNLFIEHIHKLNSFVPPTSTRENAQKWYNQGYDIANKIVNKRQALVQQINEIINNEINLLEKESQSIREKVLHTHVYNEEQLQAAFERDIEPLFTERKQFLQESILNRTKMVYEQLTNVMHEILDRLLIFIKSIAEQWDDHQNRLEHVTVQLLTMIQEYRRPHDLQNEKKLTKLDSTLDEMRSASNETALARLLNSSNDQLETLKASYAQFYDAEHSIVNKYSDMIAEEVNRYKNEMLNYFHARQIDENKIDDHPSSVHQYYTTSLTRTTYELQGYINNESDTTQQISTNNEIEQSTKSPTQRRNSNTVTRSEDVLNEQDQPQMQTFLTENPTLYTETSTDETMAIPFYEAFQIPSNLVNSLRFNLCRAFLDYYDQWKEETIRRANAIMYSKHDELDKEMDFQMHLHEPRRVRIETDIHNVRAAEIVMHDERVERHIRGVQETLEQIDADYGRMLKDFSKSISTYKDDIFNLEQVFVNATTSNRLLALQDRLQKQRDTLMNNIRVSLRSFRKRFDDSMQYLRQANAKFRKSFKTFSEGGNFSRDEIEIYRKKLEKTIFQIDKAETTILNELEKLEKKQLDEASKIMTQFQERFKNHMTDLQFIELTNRWISETQVKIKSEVAINNEHAQMLKTLILTYQAKIDSILNPNLDKQVSTLNEIRELFHQIVLTTYERALYLKCLNNELTIPASLITILKDKGLITEKALVNDLVHVTGTEETNLSRRPSRMSAGIGGNTEEVKSVKFASSSSPTTSSSRNKTESSTLIGLTGGHSEDLDTISIIRSLLHQEELPDSDEIVEPGVPAAIELNTRPIVSDSPTPSSHGKKSKQNDKSQSLSNKESSSDETRPATRRDRPIRARTRDEIYNLYCTFGEKKHTGQDFLSKILNILRESTEGLFTHSEIFYRDKGVRPVTRPQALREKFDEFAQVMIEKLKNYEEQCRSYHENSINEFRNVLELFERTSTLMAKIEFNEQLFQAEEILFNCKQQFDMTLNKELNESNNEKQINFQQLRPTFGDPAKKNHLQTIDNQEKLRQDNVQKICNELRANTIKNIQINSQETINSLATNAERLLILFDEILTADEITRTKLPKVKQSLSELLRRQQTGGPLEDSEPTPLIERKQGHWPGLPLLDDQLNPRRDSTKSKKRSSIATQRQTTSASIVTQKTTLPQIETIKQRDQVYQRYKEILIQILADVEGECSAVLAELDRDRSYWKSSIEKLQQLRTN
ncbi:unnamed protein product [Rotaria sordida]|uniref:Coiled-coil domain-containing protein 180-like n=1 Tax=Rotaria sordida TaxID=392033 RepID=A0A814Q040_9BILA|nr:unnamed protein product [Rotaria sordida]CAF1112941.1 unnamed protein product [Rotaria sordida]